MFFIGIIGKAAQFPLHEWLPDMLVGTPSSSNALTECLAGPFLLIRVLPIFRNAYLYGFEELSYFFLLVAWIGAITGLITALTATAQKHPQKIMAYSVSSIIGYMITAIGLAGLGNNMVSGYLAGTTILTIDAFVSALLILTTVFVSYAVNSEDLFKMGKFKNKLAHRGMEIAVFAMICVPPFSGFWLSNWVQALALEVGGQAFVKGQIIMGLSGYGLFALLILTGGVTAFYGLRLMGLIFSSNSTKRKTRNIPKIMRLSFIGLLGITLILDISVPLFIPILNKFFFSLVGSIIFKNFIDVFFYIIPSISTIMTLIALFVGSYVSRKLYITHEIDPKELEKKHLLIAKTRSIFLNRFYFNYTIKKITNYVKSFSKKLYRTVEMEGNKRLGTRGISEVFGLAMNWLISYSKWIYPTLEQGFFEKINNNVGKKAGRFSRWMYSFVELKGFEKSINNVGKKAGRISRWMYSFVELKGFEKINQKVAKTVSKISEKIRKMQTGILSYNMLIMLIGLIVIAILLIFGGYVKI
jgi:NADH:ubiquinone oxidoreductase subunit 5 (subunit L)/multisubunit Na+/H+ antiporter MnhA subunit